MLRKIIFVIVVTAVVACENAKEEKTKLTKAQITGFYEQQGEGEIIEFNDSLVIFYNSSSFNCYSTWKMSREEFNTNTPSVKLIDEETFSNQEGYTILKYKKLKEEPTVCKDLSEQEIASNSYNFETLWHTFNDQYAFFNERNIDWKVIKTKYQSKFNDNTPPFEFYLLIEKMVLELKDDHSDFEVPNEFDVQWHKLNQKSDTTDYRKLAKDKILSNFITEVKKYNGGQIAWGNIGEKISYIQINGMDGLADYQTANASEYWDIADESDDPDQDLIDGTHKIASKIVSEIQDKDACVIDLRFNQGGFDWIGLAFMSHFIDKKYTVFKKKRRYQNSYSEYQFIDLNPSTPNYLKKVYLLTSPFTVSAAETTTIATMVFPNVTVIGDNTVGALSDMLFKQLPNGWIYSLSNEVYETMDGKSFEVTGVPPDYKIEYPREETALFKTMNLEFNNQDRAIEKVKELMK